MFSKLLIPVLTLAAVAIPAGAQAQYRSDNYGYGNSIRCESFNGRTNWCSADVRYGLRLIRQLSNTPCIEGRSWGVDRRGLWVGNGCRGEFAVSYGGGGNDNRGRWDDRYGGGNDRGRWDDRYDGGYGQDVRCESIDGRTQWCRADTRYGVRLERQLSRSACVQGRSWGHDQRGIWVSQGCRATFELGDRRGHGGGSGGSPNPWPGYSNTPGGNYGGGNYPGGNYGGGNAGYGQSFVCESHDRRYSECRFGTNFRNIVFERQLSNTPCQQGYSWGVTHGGVWVNNGCRAQFRAY